MPAELAAGRVSVEQFVPWTEAAPSYWSHSDLTWRRIAALRRWQDELVAWAESEGLTRSALRDAGLWPATPPPFAAPPEAFKGARYF